MKSIIDELTCIRSGNRAIVDTTNTNRYRIVCIEQDGSKTAYCFSVPIYNIFDRTLLDMTFHKEDSGLCLIGSNSKITIDNGVSLKNCVGCCLMQFPEVNGREKVQIFPTTNGLACIYHGTKIHFRLSTDRSFFWVKHNKKCFCLMQEKFTPFVTVSCIGTIGANKSVTAPAKIEYKKISSQEYELTVFSEHNDAEGVFFEINLHETKVVQDTTVESKYIKNNNAFGSVAFVGHTQEYDEQWLYARPELMRVGDLFDKIINRASFFYPTYDKGRGAVSAFMLNTRFCSFGSNWDNKKTPTVQCVKGERFLHYQKLDITKMITRNGLLSDLSQGWVIRNTSADPTFCVMATGDSFFNPPIIEINYVPTKDETMTGEALSTSLSLSNECEVFYDMARLAIPPLAEDSVYPYLIEYDPHEKELLFSILKIMKCRTDNVCDCANCILVYATKKQLKVIKTLNCILRLECNDTYTYCPTLSVNAANVWKELLRNREDKVTRYKAIILGAFSNDTQVLSMHVGGLAVEVQHYSMEDANSTAKIINIIGQAISNGVNLLHFNLVSRNKSNLLRKLLDMAKASDIIITASAENSAKAGYPFAFDNVVSISRNN